MSLSPDDPEYLRRMGVTPYETGTIHLPLSDEDVDRIAEKVVEKIADRWPEEK